MKRKKGKYRVKSFNIGFLLVFSIFFPSFRVFYESLPHSSKDWEWMGACLRAERQRFSQVWVTAKADRFTAFSLAKLCSSALTNTVSHPNSQSYLEWGWELEYAFKPRKLTVFLGLKLTLFPSFILGPRMRNEDGGQAWGQVPKHSVFTKRMIKTVCLRELSSNAWETTKR